MKQESCDLKILFQSWRIQGLLLHEQKLRLGSSSSGTEKADKAKREQEINHKSQNNFSVPLIIPEVLCFPCLDLVNVLHKNMQIAMKYNIFLCLHLYMHSINQKIKHSRNRAFTERDFYPWDRKLSLEVIIIKPFKISALIFSTRPKLYVRLKNLQSYCPVKWKAKIK